MYCEVGSEPYEVRRINQKGVGAVKKLWRVLWVVLLIAFSAANTQASTKMLGTVNCGVKNMFSDRYERGEMDMYVDDAGRLYFSVNRQAAYITMDDFKAFFLALKKSKEWGQISIANSLEASKKLASFMRERDYAEHGVSLTFHSAHTNHTFWWVYMKLNAFDNPLIEREVSLDPEDVDAVMRMMGRYPDAVNALRQSKGRADKLLR